MSISASQVAELRRRTSAGMMDCKKALKEAEGDMDKAISLLKEWGIAKAAKKGDRGATEGVMVPMIVEDQSYAVLVEVNCETDFVSNTQEYKDFARRIAEMILEQKITDKSQIQENITGVLAEGISKFGENIVVGKIQPIESTGIIGSYVHTNYKNATIVSLEGEGNLNQDILKELAKDLAVHISANSVSGITEEDLDPAMIAEQKEQFLKEVMEQGKPAEIADKIVQGRINKILKEELLLQQPFLKDEQLTIEQLLMKLGKDTSTTLTVKAFVKHIIGE